MDNPIPPVAAPQSPVPGKKRLVIKIVIITVAALFVGGSAALGYFYYQKNQHATDTDYLTDTTDNSSNIPSLPVDRATTTTPGTPTTTPSAGDYILGQCKNRLAVLPSKSGMVSWKQPERLDNLQIVKDEYTSDTVYLVGRFVSGKYQGGDFLILIIKPEGPSLDEYYRVARLNNKYYILGKYSDKFPDYGGGYSFTIPVQVDNEFDLPDLDFPQTMGVMVEGYGEANLTLAANAGFFRNGHGFFCADNLRKVFSNPKAGDVYTDNGALGSGSLNGFYVKSPDGTQITYQLDVGFIGKDNIPLITWNDGSKNKDEYSYQAVGGCGRTNFRDIADVPINNLAQIGTTFLSQPVYGYKDSNAQELKDLYESYYVLKGQTKPSYQSFVVSRPIFFWQDIFGKFIRFKDTKYLPMAECAKPVIYLYPEKSQKVNVRLSPAGGFSYTEPEYNNGWNVLAEPNGQLVNLADGKTYPYLFWEGRGGIYESPSKGFVVTQKDLHQFLADKLHQLGLNDKETADFLEYWEPKMQDSPYYFVSFYTGSAVDMLAPLNISPKPDTVIRILMDFMPLQQPIQVEGYQIHTPERKGFTVVEWGGVLK